MWILLAILIVQGAGAAEAGAPDPPRPAGAAGPIRRPGHPRGVGDRQEPATPGDLLGPQRLGERPPALRGPGRRPDRPPVPAGHPEPRLGRHRDRRPGTSLPGRHRQQRRAAARPDDLPARRARPVVARGRRSRGPAARHADRRATRCPPRTGSTPRACSTTGGRGRGRQVPRRPRGRAVRRGDRSGRRPRVASPPRPIGRLPGFTRARHGRGPERRRHAPGGLLVRGDAGLSARAGRGDVLGAAGRGPVRGAADRGGRLGRARPDPGGRGGAGAVSPARGGLAGRRAARKVAPERRRSDDPEQRRRDRGGRGDRPVDRLRPGARGAPSRRCWTAASRAARPPGPAPG